ncbi:DUF134 domain-containing protein [Chlorobium limicola]|uniref:UPF0251 protein ASB62_09760 n=1 Tax=Chlorobium limicola TaxID=1092 RepID=A0A117MJ74_CHLLI|nr:DUF134 domain-containing protein [Chlorobium limicola]KUL20261.1 hypothetical protein ASB62_09760 [Chlorobium limicola]
MTRPVKCRKVSCEAPYRVFRPAGSSADAFEEVVLSFDELEAIRLADVEGLYQEEAARQMNVSRQTFGNILASARHKVGEMLIYGRQLTVTGGNIMVTSEERVFRCAACGHEWSLAHGLPRPDVCPSCANENIHRRSPGGGFGGGRMGGGRCRGLKTGQNREGRGHGEGRGQGCGSGAGVHGENNQNDHAHGEQFVQQ